jgi:GxxExxY protein
VEFQLRKIPFSTELPYPVFYKGVRLPSLYRADFVCMDAIIVEVKSLPVKTGKVEQAQNAEVLAGVRTEGGSALELRSRDPGVSQVRDGRLGHPTHHVSRSRLRRREKWAPREKERERNGFKPA